MIHAAESPLLAKDADTTAKLLSGVAPVLAAIKDEKKVAIRAGAVLILKTIEAGTMVQQLTAQQQLILDHQPRLLFNPDQIAQALGLVGPTAVPRPELPAPPPSDDDQSHAASAD